MKLSKRLQLIADVIIKYKQGSVLADIGTDHGYLPCYLVENKIIASAYACDVAKGPLESSKEAVCVRRSRFSDAWKWFESNFKS